MSHRITREIYFKHVPSYDEMTDFSYFLMIKAAENRIGLNINITLTPNAAYKYPIKDYIKEGYMPYELMDAQWSGACEKLFSNIGVDAKMGRIINLNETRLPDVKKF